MERHAKVFGKINSGKSDFTVVSLYLVDIGNIHIDGKFGKYYMTSLMTYFTLDYASPRVFVCK